MRLVLTKNQNKGMIGGVSFEVKAQVQLTSEEQKLVQHYKLENEILLKKPLTLFGQPTNESVEVRVRQLLNGEGFKCKSLGEVLEYSEGLRGACETLKDYLAVASAFGGQEVIEY